MIVYQPNDPEANGLIERLDAVLAQPITISSGTAVHCPASIGRADTTTVGYDAAALLAAADAAMYVVKRARSRGRERVEPVLAS